MKKTKAAIGIMVMAIFSLSAISCKNTKKEQEMPEGRQSQEMQDHSGMDHGDMHMTSSAILADYLELKNALVSDNRDAAARAGEKLGGSLKDFDKGKFTEAQQTELNGIIKDAGEHAEHIAESEMSHQREHFKILSQDIVDLVAITGTEHRLYEQYCPMYDNNKGGTWLSMDEEIRNPYFGNRMLTCGKVQREIE